MRIKTRREVIARGKQRKRTRRDQRKAEEVLDHMRRRVAAGTHQSNRNKVKNDQRREQL